MFYAKSNKQFKYLVEINKETLLIIVNLRVISNFVYLETTKYKSFKT